MFHCCELAAAVKFHEPASVQPWPAARYQNTPTLSCMMPASAGARDSSRGLLGRAARLASETPGQ